MKNSTLFIKLIICILLLTSSLQSCVLYYKTSPEKAATFENRRIKIKTKDDIVHKVNWIKIQEDTIKTTTNVQRQSIKKIKIDKYMICEPECSVIDLEKALISKGEILVRTNELRYRSSIAIDSYNYRFCKIVDEGDYIIGYHMNRKDTTNISIPINNINKIKAVDKAASVTVSILGIIPAFFITWYIIAMSAPSNL